MIVAAIIYDIVYCIFDLLTDFPEKMRGGFAADIGRSRNDGFIITENSVTALTITKAMFLQFTVYISEENLNMRAKHIKETILLM